MNNFLTRNVVTIFQVLCHTDHMILHYVVYVFSEMYFDALKNCLKIWSDFGFIEKPVRKV